MRLVVTKRNYNAQHYTRSGTAGDEIRPDSYRERLVKYIPVEAIVLFVAAYGSTYAILGFQPYFSLLARWIFLAGIVATLLWLWKIEEVTDWVQLMISSFGFIIWVFAFGVVPVAELPWYNQVVAALFLPVYVFGTPLIEGIPESW